MTSHPRHRVTIRMNVHTGTVESRALTTTRGLIYGPSWWWTRRDNAPTGTLTVTHDGQPAAVHLADAIIATLERNPALRERASVRGTGYTPDLPGLGTPGTIDPVPGS